MDQYEFLGAGVPTKKAGCQGNNGGQLATQNIALVEHARSPISWVKNRRNEHIPILSTSKYLKEF